MRRRCFSNFGDKGLIPCSSFNVSSIAISINGYGNLITYSKRAVSWLPDLNEVRNILYDGVRLTLDKLSGCPGIVHEKEEELTDAYPQDIF